MSIKNLGIIGGGQLGSLLAVAAKKLNIKTTIYCDDIDAPAQNFCDNFIYGNYEFSNLFLRKSLLVHTKKEQIECELIHH